MKLAPASIALDRKPCAPRRVITWALKWLCRYLGAGCAMGVLLAGRTQALDFAYTNTNGTISITGYIGPGGNVAIPAIIDGLPVRDIGGLAFVGNTNLTAVTIPDSVTNIEDGLAFMAAASGA